MANRPFRSEESFAFEKTTRNQIKPFLSQYGFSVLDDARQKHGSATSQTITANDPSGKQWKMKVRLCWRQTGRNEREHLYSAAQLRARPLNGDWLATVKSVAERGADEGVNAIMFVQAGADGITSAAIVPNDQLVLIWQAQRTESDHLIGAGLMGGITKNHAENGSSPTIWLSDERTPSAHKVSDVLWSWPGVVNVTAFPQKTDEPGKLEDTFADLSLDRQMIGRDSGEEVKLQRSGWTRDPKVRAAVLARANGRCERAACQETRPFSGFLDVHHILGVWATDRPWTCVALCPNCHRDAHFSPERDSINEELLRFASKFR